ncbi:MAG: tetratricopeptide repeat protein [Candidatus Eisenbacteria bacterium]|nr:tetratricopeptide repeat protein [Candidatus Eisenbacteria bacterium]
MQASVRLGSPGKPRATLTFTMLPSRTSPVLVLLFLLGFAAPVFAAQTAARAADSTRSGVPPEEATRHYLQGRLLEEAGDTDGAVSELTRALALDPSAVGVLLRLSEASSRAGDPSRALQLARRAVAIDSTNAQAHWLAGRGAIQPREAHGGGGGALQGGPARFAQRELPAHACESGRGGRSARARPARLGARGAARRRRW